MEMQIVPFDPVHLQTLNIQAAQAWLSEEMLKPEYAALVASAGVAFSGVDGDTLVGCAGLMSFHKDRAVAWALLSQQSGPHFVKIFRAMQRYLEVCDIRRIEAQVDSTFAAGHRLVKMLGFSHEGRMRAYFPDGRDADLYARIQ